MGSREGCCPTGKMGREGSHLAKEDKHQGPEAGPEYIAKTRIDWLGMDPTSSVAESMGERVRLRGVSKVPREDPN